MEKEKNNKKPYIYFSTKKLVFVALFTAINVILSSSVFCIPTPGNGHLYLNDIVICLSALVFDPLSAIIIGGFGAFFGDLFFYPSAMFVSLIVRSVQAFIISAITYRQKGIARFWISFLAVMIGVFIMVGGYFLGKAFFYGTLADAIIKIPFSFIQAGTGVVVALLLLYKSPLKTYIDSFPKK